MIAKKYKLKIFIFWFIISYASFLILKHKPKNKINFLKKKFKNLIIKN